jgi:hypothetical protein
LLIDAIVSARLAGAAAAAEDPGCLWCGGTEGAQCMCTGDCGRRDCPAGLAVHGVSPFCSSPVPVPRFR